jgi:hypothetical protein
MTEVNSSIVIGDLSKIEQPELTKDGEFEFFNYQFFDAVDYDRLLSWKAGVGSVSVGISNMSPMRANKAMDDMVIFAGITMLVINTTIKLVRR